MKQNDSLVVENPTTSKKTDETFLSGSKEDGIRSFIADGGNSEGAKGQAFTFGAPGRVKGDEKNF
mgnify:FL=1